MKSERSKLPADVSTRFCFLPQTGYFSQEVGPSSSVIGERKTGILKSNHDVFLTLTKCVVCLNLSRA